MSLLIDTHAHLYSSKFTDDRDEMIARCKEKLSHVFLPNIDLESVDGMMDLATKYKDFCFPMMGLHPCSVGEDYKKVLSGIENFLPKEKWYGIGETGLDYYWDKTWIKEQKYCLDAQIAWAKEMQLPLILHCRESMDDVIAMVETGQDGKLFGIFHCFTGNEEQAKRIIGANFVLGIGGVITYKTSDLPMVLKDVPMEKIVLETDSPYLGPVPFRGKRNESAYVTYVAEKLAEAKGISFEEVAAATSANALKVFGI